MNKTQKKFIMLCILAFLVYLINVVTVSVVFATQMHTMQVETNQFNVIAAAIAVVGSGGAAGYAIAKTGSAAIALLSEKEESFFKAFLIVSLAEAIAIYGLIVALIILLL